MTGLFPKGSSLDPTEAEVPRPPSRQSDCKQAG